MNTVSTFLGNKGAPIVVPLADGKELHVYRADIGSRTKIEQRMKAEVRNQLLEDRHDMTDEEYGIAYEAFLRLVASQEMRYGGTLYRKYVMSSPGGMALMMMLCRWADGKELKQDELDAVIADPENLAAIKLATSQAVEESYPKGPAPAPGPGSTAPDGPLVL